MQTVIPGLYASTPQALSFAPSAPRPGLPVATLAGQPARLQRRHPRRRCSSDRGARRCLAPLPESLARGRVRRRRPGCQHLRERRCSATTTSAQRCPETVKPSPGPSPQRHMQGDDLEVIPIPGHTQRGDGVSVGRRRAIAACSPATPSTCAKANGSRRCSSSSDRGAYVESLELIKDLDFDLLVPWVATAGQPFHAITDKARCPAPHRCDSRARTPRRRSLTGGTIGGRQVRRHRGARIEPNRGDRIFRAWAIAPATSARTDGSPRLHRRRLSRVTGFRTPTSPISAHARVARDPGQGPGEVLWPRAGRSRHRVRGRAGALRRPARAERRRQDHDDAHDHGPDHAERRRAARVRRARGRADPPAQGPDRPRAPGEQPRPGPVGPPEPRGLRPLFQPAARR